MVLVGRVARPRGLKGLVVVNPETDFVAERYAVGATLWIGGEGACAPLEIDRARLGGRRPIIGFAGRISVEAVEDLAGRELRVPESALQPLGEGHYYRHQLAGCRVVTTGGHGIGTVMRVEDTGATLCLAVSGEHGEILVPFVESICLGVDVDGGQITIDPPEGLLDLNVTVPGQTRAAKGPRGV